MDHGFLEPAYGLLVLEHIMGLSLSGFQFSSFKNRYFDYTALLFQVSSIETVEPTWFLLSRK